MSKGSKQRPMNISYNDYVDKWDNIFGDKEVENIKKRNPCRDIDLTPNLLFEYELVKLKTGHT